MQTAPHPIILFDGICNFCNVTVNFIIRQDKKKIFRFAPLQSPAGQQLLQQYNLPTTNFGSFILIENGKAYQKSTAGLRLYNKLPWYWKWTQLFWIIPTFLRDFAYNIIARNRYKWFGKRSLHDTLTGSKKPLFNLNHKEYKIGNKEYLIMEEGEVLIFDI